MNSLVRGFFGIACLACTFASEAQATSLRQYDLTELVDASDLIVLGQARDQHAFWQGKRIVTATRLEVQEVWQGRKFARGELEVLSLGGVVGDIGQRVDGSAVLREGEQVVLHLKRADEITFWPVALAQGVWHLDKLENTPLRSSVVGRNVTRQNLDRLVLKPGQSRKAMPNTLSALRTAILEVARDD